MFLHPCRAGGCRLLRPSTLLRGVTYHPIHHDATNHDTRKKPRNILVIGSSGATGSAISRVLSQDCAAQVIGADVVELPSDLQGGWELDGFIEIPAKANLEELTTELTKGVHYFLQDSSNKGTRKLDAIVVASGAWSGDPEPPRTKASLQELEKGAREYAITIQSMRNACLDPVVASGYIAQHFMNPNGLLCVIGATPALGPTPGMLGYGLAKAGAHHFVTTMGSVTGNATDSKAMRRQGRNARIQLGASMDSLSVVGILPTKIDTPSNRKADPGADFDEWAKPLDIAREIRQWIENPDLRPHSGALLKITPRKTEPGISVDLVR